jgi:signal peptidase I
VNFRKRDSADNPAPAPVEELVPPQERGRGTGSFVREMAETILLTAIIFVMFYSVVQASQVDGQSMEPSLHDGERIWLNKAVYFRYDTNWISDIFGAKAQPNLVNLFHAPQRGDIIVFNPPVPSDKPYIKRVIGLPGEQVQVRQNDGVYINGKKLDEPYIKDIPDYPTTPVVTVPPDSVYVMGDNRNNSSDSHIWGFVNDDSIIGKAEIGFWPLNDLGTMPHYDYAGVGNGP